MNMVSRRDFRSPDYDLDIDDLAPAEGRKRGGIDEIFWMVSCNSPSEVLATTWRHVKTING